MAPPLLNQTPAAGHNTVSMNATESSPFHVLSDRFWALVIGIDAYPAEKDVLRGCVSDATKVSEFLTKNLGIPTDHITLLLGTTTTSRWSYNRTSGTASITGQPATRANIIDALLGLSTNSQIQKGDNVVNIIIYYSGHGTVYHCKDHPAYRSGSPASTGTIEALCPMDRKAKGFTLKGRKAIPDISDRELYTILAEISRTKGHHITVILDCCHSSGVTRHLQSEEKQSRYVKALSPSTIADMFAAADKRLGELKSDNGLEPRYQAISKGDWTPEIPVKTHVVLAACNAYEYAAEVEAVPTPGDNLNSKSERITYNGYFTVALLATLKSVIRKPANLNDKLPTYFKLVEDLVKKLKELQPNTPERPSDQHPVVAGASIHEPLWYTVQHYYLWPLLYAEPAYSGSQLWY